MPSHDYRRYFTRTVTVLEYADVVVPLDDSVNVTEILVVRQFRADRRQEPLVAPPVPGNGAVRLLIFNTSNPPLRLRGRVLIYLDANADLLVSPSWLSFYFF